MQTTHAPVDMLTAYAAGALSDGMSLLVASHLTFCPDARRRVARLEAIGGALLCAGEVAAPGPERLAAALARLDDPAPEPGAAEAPPPDDPGSPLPLPLRRRTGLRMADIRWRALIAGLCEHRLEGFEGEEVRLIRAAPGLCVPQHTHEGEEAMLILAGRLRDGDRTFARGELSLADATVEHRPQIVGPATCICLVVLTGPLRFTGQDAPGRDPFSG